MTCNPSTIGIFGALLYLAGFGLGGILGHILGRAAGRAEGREQH
jgi:hypothetical protein